MDRIVPLLLAGGAGTRLWPVSRASMPKQFIPLVGELSTYQQTLRRVCDPALFAPPVVVTNVEFRAVAAQQAAEVGVPATVVFEPARRDSAPAMLAGVLVAARGDPEAVVLALAADHVILDDALFLEATRQGAAAAGLERIVTYGIPPTRPDTAYGYIRPGEPLGEGVRAVERFVEKPDAATAAAYVREGLLWNSGNFLFRARLLLEEVRAFEPGIAAAVEAAVAGATRDGGTVRLAPEAFARSPSKSIDYAVLERTTRAAVVEGRFRWSDIGSWDAVLQANPADADGNAVSGPVLALDTRHSLLRSDGRLTAVIGLDDVVVVSTADAVLVAARSATQQVKEVVRRLQETAPHLVEHHVRSHRPWGWYQDIDRGDRFRVKRIVVAPGGRLSLQKHFHRAEHWIVVRGTAEVTIGEGVQTVRENESVYISQGAVHRLANPGRIPLELVEVQTGSYLEEDDIIRIEDIYQRV